MRKKVGLFLKYVKNIQLIYGKYKVCFLHYSLLAKIFLFFFSDVSMLLIHRYLWITNHV